jgi:microcompartment protein CcmK/EutM
MLLGRVIGTVWATRKDPKVVGMKWLVVRALKPDLKPSDGFVVAVDAVGAGLGECVLVTQGSSARQTELTNARPVDAVIVAIVDGVDVTDRKDWAPFDRRSVADLAQPTHGA